jgi:hypothetical protein
MTDTIPRGKLRWWVDRLHVGTPDADVRAGVDRLTAAWPDETDRGRAVRWALRVHHVNRARYRRIMGGHA